jgi:acetyl-CoA/propionyl-CoA carboxylase biotin carboxyl carrier protein
LQRRHQKLVEETPPPRFADRLADMGQAAVSLSKACGYVNAGTVELLVDTDGSFYFLEVNARLQVEHTVTEEVLGIDLVACQLRIASGDPLGFTQDDVEARGHAIECRINAEDPTRDFIPTPGTLESFVEPNGLGVRVDSGYASGDVIPDAYDSLLAKLVTWGKDRDEARSRMLRCLDEFEIEGVSSTIPAHKILLQLDEFVAGTHTTKTVESGVLDELEAASVADEEANVLLVAGRPVRLWSPSMAASASAAVSGGLGAGEIAAPMQGTILKVLVEPGQTVEVGDAIVILEAMKMETTLAATASGVVGSISVSPGDTVPAGHVVAVVE